MKKFDIQAEQYAFPYHYIPHLRADGTPMRARSLRWGFEYLCYQLQAVELVRELKPESVLEVGCGDGRFIGMLQPHVARCMGVDLVPQAIQFAAAFNPGVEFRCVDAAQLPGQFDVVAAIEVLEHIPDEHMAQFVRTLCERTRPGGHLLLCVPSDARPVQEKHYRHYNEAMLEAHAQSAGIRLERVLVQHVYAVPWWLKALLKVTSNRSVSIEIAPLNRWLWKQVWRRRLSKPGRGAHILSVYRRAAG